MKDVNDLAILGGKPAFSEPLHVNHPNLGKKSTFVRYVDAIFESQILTNNGPLVQKLSRDLAQYLNVKHCILTNNGTLAMSILISALELKGEVIIPSFTFISTAHTLYLKGIKPVFCDIDPKTWNLDVDHCASLITEKTTAIIPTHIWGQGCDIDRLNEIVSHYDIALIFDAAHAFGNKIGNKMIGNFGAAEVFSFHATKAFHTFEGGAITTNNSALAAKLEAARNFGFSDYDQVDLPGSNAKMPEVCAAMGLTNLLALDNTLIRTRKTYTKYLYELKRIKGIDLVEYDLLVQRNSQYIVTEIDESVIGLTRDEILKILHSENILARRYFFPGNHLMNPYKSLYPDVDFDLPITNRKTNQVLLLPGGSQISQVQVEKVCNLLSKISRYGGAISKKINMSITDSERLEEKHPSLHGQQKSISIPTVEIRIPISATSKYLRMVHYFLESLKLFGGPIGSRAKCVFSVSRDCPKEDLFKRLPWASDYNIDFHWVDQHYYDLDEYDATGYDRFYLESDADIIILADADILIAGDFDKAILSSYRNDQIMGCIAHVSPFSPPPYNQYSSLEWWTKIFTNCGLETPKFNNVHTGWGLMNKNKNHRTCPYYFNYGFIIIPRHYLTDLGRTFIGDLRKIEEVLETWFKSQIANTVGFQRYKIPCKELSVNYNFPMHIPDLAFRSLNPDPDGEDMPDDIKVFHYLGNGKFNREDFISTEALKLALGRKELTPTEAIFRNKLEEIHEIIESKNI